MWKCVLCVCSAVLFAAATPAWSNLLTNPSFEQPIVTNPDFFQYYFAGDPAITGWTIIGNSVDVQSASRWSAHDGVNTVDLTGVTSGGIYQDVPTQVGKTYHLSFWLAGNPELAGASGGPFIKTAKVSWGGNAIATLNADVTGKTDFNLGFTQYQYDLLATAATTRLQFESLSAGSAGPMLDDLKLDLVPEPTAVSLVGAALGIVIARRPRKRYC